MGRKKNKWFKKVINFYRFVFKFDIPYNIIIDGNFVAFSMQKKFDIKDQLTKSLDGNVHLIIPSCILHEIKELDDKIPGLLNIVSKLKAEEFQHNNILSPDVCIKSYIGKKNHKKYFVATQDSYLRNQLRKIPGTPLLFFSQNMILIDKPSKVSLEASKRRENLKELPKKSEKKDLIEKKEEIQKFMRDEYKKTKHYKNKREEFKIHKIMGRVRKNAKGANPLSRKKKLKKIAPKEYSNYNKTDSNINYENNEANLNKKKRKRKNKNNE